VKLLAQRRGPVALRCDTAIRILQYLPTANADYRTARVMGAFVLVLGLALTTLANFL